MLSPMADLSHRMSRPPRLPLRITLLLCLVLIITALNSLRLVTALVWRPALEVYLPPAAIPYIALSGAVWMLVGLYVLGSFWRRARHSRTVFLCAAGGYWAWTWVDRIFVRTQLPSNWPFSLILTLALLAFTITVVLDPHHQVYFRKETYEPKPES